MPDNIALEIWGLAKLSILLLIYLGVSFLAVRIFHDTLRELFRGIGSELQSFADKKPSERGMNLLFGILIFVAVMLMFAAEAIDKFLSKGEAEKSFVQIPGYIVIMIGILVLTVFFSLSVAYCSRTKR